MAMPRWKTIKDIEKYAKERTLSEIAETYFSAEAASYSTARSNELSFNKYHICPRVLRDVSNVNLECKILGIPVSCPIGVAPTGLNTLAHEEGELASALGTVEENCIFILSSVSSKLIEDVHAYVNRNGRKTNLWLQVYIHRDRSLTTGLIRKAESLGFSAIVVTVDSSNHGQWRRRLPDSFFETITSRIVNIPTLPKNLTDPSLTFEDLRWLKNNTKLPVVVKGILSKDDAVQAAECGVSAIYVSNHGSRLLERVISPIDALEEIVEAVKHQEVEVYVDGGVRTGSDAFIGLALGANAVFIGRPIVWGLSANGKDGVRNVLQILKESLKETMQLSGAASLTDVDRSVIRKYER